MITRWMLLIALGLRAPSDDGSIRQQEAVLATALRTADRSALLQLSDSQLHVKFQCGYAAKVVTLEMSRNEWIDAVTQVKTTGYQAKINEVRLLSRFAVRTNHDEELATADIVEKISLSSLKGAAEKELHASDAWIRRDGTWKLIGRIYTQVCDDGPDARFP